MPITTRQLSAAVAASPNCKHLFHGLSYGLLEYLAPFEVAELGACSLKESLGLHKYVSKLRLLI